MPRPRKRFPGGLPQPPARSAEVRINPPRDPVPPIITLTGGRDPNYAEASGSPALNILYVLVATNRAGIDRRHKSREIFFNMRRG